MYIHWVKETIRRKENTNMYFSKNIENDTMVKNIDIEAIVKQRISHKYNSFSQKCCVQVVS